MPQNQIENNPLYKSVFEEVVKQSFNEHSFKRWIMERKKLLMEDGRQEGHAESAVFLDALTELRRCTENVLKMCDFSRLKDFAGV